jgi:hypothetical protein
MKKKIVIGFASFGFFMAIVLAAVRLFMLYHAAEYGDVLYGQFFTYFTLALWPGSFYLTILQAKEPVQTVVVVWIVAIVFNAVWYGFVGWVFSKVAGVGAGE